MPQQGKMETAQPSQNDNGYWDVWPHIKTYHFQSHPKVKNCKNQASALPIHPHKLHQWQPCLVMMTSDEIVTRGTIFVPLMDTLRRNCSTGSATARITSAPTGKHFHTSGNTNTVEKFQRIKQRRVGNGDLHIMVALEHVSKIENMQLSQFCMTSIFLHRPNS